MGYVPHLSPPFGENLPSLLLSNENLRNWVSELFESMRFTLTLKPTENQISISKMVNKSIFSYPYFTISETLQRIVFYIMAIKSNKNSILLFDETLLRSLGYAKKILKHHQGKPRVIGDIRSKQSQIAMVDEDPGSAQHPYEKTLLKKEERYGVLRYRDDLKDNTVLMLKIKLEDWIISACNASDVNVKKFGLPTKPNDLHDVINYRLQLFERLIANLIEMKNPSLVQLQIWLDQTQGN